MKQANARVLVLLVALAALGLVGTGMVFGQSPAKDTPEARALELADLLRSVEGVAEEAPQIFNMRRHLATIASI